MEKGFARSMKIFRAKRRRGVKARVMPGWSSATCVLRPCAFRYDVPVLVQFRDVRHMGEREEREWLLRDRVNAPGRRGRCRDSKSGKTYLRHGPSFRRVCIHYVTIAKFW